MTVMTDLTAAELDDLRATLAARGAVTAWDGTDEGWTATRAAFLTAFPDGALYLRRERVRRLTTEACAAAAARGAAL